MYCFYAYNNGNFIIYCLHLINGIYQAWNCGNKLNIIYYSYSPYYLHINEHCLIGSIFVNSNDLNIDLIVS